MTAPKTPTYYARLQAYAQSCGACSHFNCSPQDPTDSWHSRFTQRWEAVLRVWWLHGDLRAMGRTREKACFGLWQTLEGYTSMPDSPEVQP